MDNSKNPIWVDSNMKEKDVNFLKMSTDSDGCGFNEPEDEKRLCLGSQKTCLVVLKCQKLLRRYMEMKRVEK